MPGVNVTTKVLTGPTNPAAPATAQFFAAGITQRGPVGKAVKVTNLAEYEQRYGGRTAYAGALHDTIAIYFEEGGATAQISRVVGVGAAGGSITFEDQASSPDDTLTINAASPGAWADDLTVAIEAGTNSDTFKIVVEYDGETVQTLDNITSPQNAVTRLASSTWITAEDEGSTEPAPANNPAPAAAASLSGGDDDRGSISNTDAVDALDTFGRDLGPGAVALPGWDAADVGSKITAHAKATDRIALLSGPVGDDADQAANTAATITDAEYAGYIFPWVNMPDAGGARPVPPEGYAAAVRARATADVGFWQVPAGDRANARFITGTTTTIDKEANNKLAENKISGIATIGGKVKLYGWFSLSGDENFALLTARDSLNAITAAARTILEPYVWETVDGRGLIMSQIDSTVRGYLQPIAEAGGFYASFNDDGDELDPGYSVRVNELNDPNNLANNEVRVGIGIRLSPSAKEINVTITKAALTAAL